MARSRSEAVGSARAKPEPQDEGWLLDDVAAVLSLTAAAFMVLSFFAYQNELANLNFAGRVGHGLADVGVQTLGYAAYLIPLDLILVALLLFRHKAHELSIPRVVAAIVLLLCVAVLLGVAAPPPPIRPVTLAGGWLGGFLASVLAQGFGTLGTAVLVGAMLVLSVVFATRLSLSRLVGGGVGSIATGWSRVRHGAAGPVREARETVIRKPRANLKRTPAGGDAAPVIVLADVERDSASAKKRPPPIQ